jgi:predicted N-acetyltransferase YhbS
MTKTIRLEIPNNYSQIKKLKNHTFNQPNEGKIIEALRKNRKFIPEHSLVAEIDSKIPKQVRNDFTKKYNAQNRELMNTVAMHL